VDSLNGKTRNGYHGASDKPMRVELRCGDMEKYTFEFDDRVFFERYEELSDKQIRFYLGLRKAARLASNPRVKEELLEGAKGTLGIDQADLVMDLELLCDKCFIRRERIG
jgi:hypothetical protein